MFKKIPNEVKQEILEKIKNGLSVSQASQIYGISRGTIYLWLEKEGLLKDKISITEYNRLKKENEELKRIIGMITLKLERGKKNRNYKKIK